jgi:hypothetical protein
MVVTPRKRSFDVADGISPAAAERRSEAAAGERGSTPRRLSFEQRGRLHQRPLPRRALTAKFRLLQATVGIRQRRKHKGTH